MQEAIAIVREEGGPDSVSLREVQRRAGVSPAAAYRHFRDREALLLAVAQESAGLLADHLAAALAAAPAPVDASAARARLLAACEAYVEFATRNPGLYRAVFFSGEQIDELLSPSERARGSAGDGGYNLLVATLQDLATATGGAAVNQWDPLVVWSCCHGLAMLRLDAALRALSEQDFSRARDRVLHTIAGAVPLETLTHGQPA
ncbi:TetR/AcrR family transcriptional regulator [Sinomonas sp. ASV322]|uniref:TetR/AcrR family transcriptional regulator n=1 Tax=Sinomonas sp. ASV322 TaxID=3041920 RepID=UPI0027DC2254|nr:TetR/AcrR family transcriptional regulator [Sinomonas sp. ASV322]MDQ4503060.1 TetR/AcrR family transcriptional regulator [Sinomonas sp. ASV322]